MKIKEVVTEAAMSVGLQSRYPVSSGARSLMASRWRYDAALKNNNKEINKNAVDQLQYDLKQLGTPGYDNVQQLMEKNCYNFRIDPNLLHNLFSKKFNCSPLQYAVNYKKSRQGQPVKV